ncbi:MAG: hypothetical protein ABW139_11335 [Candidatus Thiodiazotropha sp. DIVDIV]
MHRVAKVIRILMFGLTVGLIAGCDNSMTSKELPYIFSSEVLDKLSSFSQKGPQGATYRLEDATTFNWDEVHVFHGGESGRFINQHIGQKMFDDNDYYGERWTLMVFTDHDKVVHAVSFVPPLFFNIHKKVTFQRIEAIVLAHSKDPGPYSLMFKE